MPPAAGEVRRALRAYFDEVASSYYGRQATQDEITAAMWDDPSDDLTRLMACFSWRARMATCSGCAGLRLLPGRINEVTRVLVVPAARRQGLAYGC